MDYFVWSQEYYKEAEKIKRNLLKMKEKLKKISMYERRTLEDNIQKLQIIYYECLHTANYLESIARGKRDAA